MVIWGKRRLRYLYYPRPLFHNTDEILDYAISDCLHKIIDVTIHLFVRSLFWAGVQPTVDPSIETFMLVQCTSPERRGELVGVCGVCMCV